MSTENPVAHVIARFDLTGNGTLTDTQIRIDDSNRMGGQVIEFVGDRMGDHLNQEDSGCFVSAPTGAVELFSEPLIGTSHYFVQNTGDPMTIAAPEGATIYLGTTPTSSITSGGMGSTCLLIYSADGVWQGLFSGAWSSAG